MKHSEFKRLPHRLGPLRIEKDPAPAVHHGYRPDVTVVNENNELTLILDSERTIDRKAFLGVLIKAQKYAEERNATPMLIIVMQPNINTSVKHIADHLQPYTVWLNKNLVGGLKLAKIFLISDDQYQYSVMANELLGAEEFLRRGITVSMTPAEAR